MWEILVSCRSLFLETMPIPCEVFFVPADIDTDFLAFDTMPEDKSFEIGDLHAVILRPTIISGMCL